jgi:hypothetical protein
VHLAGAASEGRVAHAKPSRRVHLLIFNVLYEAVAMKVRGERGAIVVFLRADLAFRTCIG